MSSECEARGNDFVLESSLIYWTEVNILPRAEPATRADFSNNSKLNISGVVLLTMSFLGGTPVECTLHPKLWNDNYTKIAMDDDDEPPDDEFSMYQNRNMSELVIT